METVLPPVVVCGMPRTGTTLIRRALDASPDLVIFREMGVEVVLPALHLLGIQKHRLATSDWLELSGADIEQRLLVELRHLWEAGQGKGEPGYGGERRFGVKEPNLELHRRMLDVLLGTAAPTYVYVMRDFADVYESMLRQPWKAKRSAAFGRSLRASLEAAVALASEAPERLVVLDLDELSASRERRVAVIDRVLAHLGAAADDGTREFVNRWPPMNRVPENRGGLSDDQMRRRVESFTAGRAHAEAVEQAAVLRRHGVGGARH